MDTKRRYLREWRKFRGKTQEQVVAALEGMDDPNLPSTGASLSRLETGKQSYNERSLAALAAIYDCEPWELLGRDPYKEGEVIDFGAKFSKLDAQQRAQALAILDALTKTG
jgi:transcriptional regulator with XRE-family HTH domain